MHLRQMIKPVDRAARIPATDADSIRSSLEFKTFRRDPAGLQRDGDLRPGLIFHKHRFNAQPAQKVAGDILGGEADRQAATRDGKSQHL